MFTLNQVGFVSTDPQMTLHVLADLITFATGSVAATLQSRENGRFYTRELIIRLDELGQTFVVRLVMRL